MSDVLDASAVLAFLRGEDGASVVEDALEAGSAVVSAANWCEIAQKVRSAGGDWPWAAALLDSYGIGVEQVTRADAERAAALWRRGSGLSLADRLCLSVAERLDRDVLTADRAWGEGERIRQIR
ncbi:PIN domain-containing protein [Galbitalea sp. SE-J8]|uniref:PIN domain-containing protein n=1 Tax=Galbitalea sp. SE-J8 TaxID=3054952 RepID=UPI00259C9402|nr:PIN domain-containing protein [Galbitalea sp. SE-J8]MDM4763260.1 PIN domain-containing protein [Galbitalea sp. SE-J8]